MGKLGEWANDQRGYFTLENGESIKVKFLSFRTKPSTFDPEKQVVEYKFQLEDGKTKTWDNGSAKTADKFDKVKEGQWVVLSRVGEGTKTEYFVKVLDDNEAPAGPEDFAEISG